jgi:hypothetical protein
LQLPSALAKRDRFHLIILALDRVTTSVFAQSPNMVIAVKAVDKIRARRRNSQNMGFIYCGGSH